MDQVTSNVGRNKRKIWEKLQGRIDDANTTVDGYNLLNLILRSCIYLFLQG